MESTPGYLFVYGTLRQNSQHPMYVRLAQQADFVADAWFVGKLYRVTYYPCVIPSDNQTDRVIGELYQLRNLALLAQLDDYEECSDKHSDPKEYVREKKLVHTVNGDAVMAWVYLYNRPVHGLVQIKSGDFLQSVVE
jgi:gamma-glutamylcyclotransferase (GGCT)/AIG2-like uncharacterized protein YtfP